MLSTILVPLDGSRLAEHALPEARRIACETGATIVLVRVAQSEARFNGPLVTPAAAVAEANAYLWQVEQALSRDGFSVRTEILCDDPADAIALAGAVHDAGLIVMSTHGRAGIGRVILGSVAEQVLHTTRVPVLLVRVCHLTGRPLTGPYRRVLVPLDSTPLAIQTLRYVTHDAITRQATITLLHVEQQGVPAPFAGALVGPLVSPATEVVRERSDSAWYLDALAEQFMGPNRSWHLYTASGDPATAILRLAEEQDIDLIVMATHDRHGLDRMLHGSVTTRVLHQADVPILVMHGTVPAMDRLSMPEARVGVLS